jgi:hypothetical protein
MTGGKVYQRLGDQVYGDSRFTHLHTSVHIRKSSGGGWSLVLNLLKALGKTPYMGTFADVAVRLVTMACDRMV